jgi:hypothetical protein
VGIRKYKDVGGFFDVLDDKNRRHRSAKRRGSTGIKRHKDNFVTSCQISIEKSETVNKDANKNRNHPIAFSIPQICLEDVRNSIPRAKKALTTFIAPPTLSPAELKEQEAEATLTVQKIIVGAVLLYLCKYLPGMAVAGLAD